MVSKQDYPVIDRFSLGAQYFWPCTIPKLSLVNNYIINAIRQDPTFKRTLKWLLKEQWEGKRQSNGNNLLFTVIKFLREFDRTNSQRGK